MSGPADRDAQVDETAEDEAESSRSILRQQMREQARVRAGAAPHRRNGALALASVLAVLLITAFAAIAIVLSGTPLAGLPQTISTLPGWFGASAPPELPPPVVEPPKLMDVSPDTAFKLNAAVPYAPGPVPAAARFVYAGSPENRAAARVCLAGALFYEAGNDPIDQYAVAQVVVNRLRHPAFPKTVCGVVFQGAERSTGCQFTFACDGALERRPSAAAWNAALASADAVLGGFVFTPVGTATHYHTDQVFPYWQSSLTKLVKIHTHIFYRWAGWWGTTNAFSGRPGGDERVESRLLAAVAQVNPALSPVVISSELPAATIGVTPAPAALESVAPSLRIPGLPAGLLKKNIVRFVDAKGETVLLHLDSSAYSGSFAVLSNAICADKPACLVVGFVDDAAIPKTMEQKDDTMRRGDFVFQRKPGIEAPAMLWNCAIFPRSTPAQCRAK